MNEDHTYLLFLPLSALLAGLYFFQQSSIAPTPTPTLIGEWETVDGYMTGTELKTEFATIRKAKTTCSSNPACGGFYFKGPFRSELVNLSISFHESSNVSVRSFYSYTSLLLRPTCATYVKDATTDCASCIPGYQLAGTTCKPWECTTGPLTGCASCVEQSLRKSTTDCASCNEGYNISGTTCISGTTFWDDASAVRFGLQESLQLGLMVLLSLVLLWHCVCGGVFPPIEPGSASESEKEDKRPNASEGNALDTNSPEPPASSREPLESFASVNSAPGTTEANAPTEVNPPSEATA